MKRLFYILITISALGLNFNHLFGQCEAGDLLTVDMACSSNGTFDLATDGTAVPGGGVFGWAFSDQLGGTGGLTGGFSLPDFPTTITFDSDLNGVLSYNSLPPLSGSWVVIGFVADASGATCSTTVDSLIVNFDLEGPVIDDIAMTAADELTVTASGGVPPYTFLWDDANAQTTATAVGLDNTASFTVIVTDDNGCQVASTFDFDPELIVCTAGTLTSVGEIAICDAAETFDITATMDTLPPGGLYGWAGSDILGGTGAVAGGFTLTGVDPVLETYDAGLNGVLAANNLDPLSGTWVFRGAVIDADGNTCSLTADSLIVNFGTESPTISEITLSGSGELTVNATGGVEPYSYLWDDPAAQTTQTATGLDAGIVYTVIVVDANGCLVSGESEATVSTNSIASLNAHSIVPNPNNGSFSVQLNFDNSEFVEVQILDITGRIVETANRELTSGNFDFNLDNTAQGVYFVRIIAGEESITQRIIVSK